jgi:hypothetical protein
VTRSPNGGNTLNKTTRLVDTYHTFTKEMDELEETQSRIDAIKYQSMERYFTNNINRLSSLIKKKRK